MRVKFRVRSEINYLSKSTEVNGKCVCVCVCVCEVSEEVFLLGVTLFSPGIEVRRD